MNRRIGFPQILFGLDGGGGGAPAGSTPGGSAPSPGGTSAASPTTPSSPEPSSTPSQVPQSVPAGGGLKDAPEIQEDPFDFQSVLEGAPELPESVVPPTAQPEPPKAPPQQQPAAQPPAPPAQAAVVPQVAPVPVPASAATGQQEASPPLSPAEPGRMAQVLGQNEAFVTQQVAEQIFALSKEEVEALEADTVATIPKLLAKVYVKMQQAMLSQLQSSVPAMVHHYNTMRTKNSENENVFFKQFPDLDPAKHGDVVRRLAVVYRKMNPSATLEQMVADLGPMAMMAAGVTPTARVPGQPPAATPPANGVRAPQPSPFMPAAASGGMAALPSTAAKDDPWGFLGQTA